MVCEKLEIEVSLVERLVAEQFPQWAKLPINPVKHSGWDNRTFHLGQQMTVRLPSAAEYADQVDKEHRWLPLFAPHLPVPIPLPLGKGSPGQGYPWHWSVYQWLEGENAASERICDMSVFAIALAEFLFALQTFDTTDGPHPGRHNFFRGGSLKHYDQETRNAIEDLGNVLDSKAVFNVWNAALETDWCSDPVWVHGDVSAGNLLVKDGRLSAVIDFGCSAIGDPACDLAIAWTFFQGDSRKAFRANLPLDSCTWARGRAWTLWKALITACKQSRNSVEESEPMRVISEVLADHLSI